MGVASGCGNLHPGVAEVANEENHEGTAQDGRQHSVQVLWLVIICGGGFCTTEHAHLPSSSHSDEEDGSWNHTHQKPGAVSEICSLVPRGDHL